MSYALASYAVAIAGLLAYAVRLERERRRLARALETRSGPNRG